MFSAVSPTTRSTGSTSCFPGDMLSKAELMRAADAHTADEFSAVVEAHFEPPGIVALGALTNLIVIIIMAFEQFSICL
jgi:hypothetical protein